LFEGGSRWNRQNEIIRSLKKQLEATERELANKEWVFEQFLQSPSWRLTYPLRWLAKQFRSLRRWANGSEDRPAASAADTAPSDGPDEEDNTILNWPPGPKEVFSDCYRVQLLALLAAGTRLRLPHSETPLVSVILVLFNRAELTLACLRSLREQAVQDLEIIIVDNASKDETSSLLERVEGVRVIRNPENAGFLLAVNQAAREARGEYLLLLNNDAQLLPETLSAALATIRSAPDIGAVGGRIVLLDGVLQEAGSMIWRNGGCLGYGRGDDPFAPMYMFRRDVDYCSGVFLLTPRRVWNQLGGFDVAFRPAYYEETDYCMRLWERGLRVVYEPNAVVLHYEFASTQTIEEVTTLQERHQSVFARKHHAVLAGRADAPAPESVLETRMRPSPGGRVLFLDDRVPHTWLGSGFPRAHAILRALVKQGRFVTVYPLGDFPEEWSSVYSDMPAEVEFMMGYGRLMLEAFLRERRGYYDTIIVSRPHNMNVLRGIIAARPAWFENVSVIYDAEALSAWREIARRELIGEPLPADEVSRLLAEEVDLASKADCVISVAEYERALFRKLGVARVHVLGHSIAARPTPRRFRDRAGFLFVGAIHDESSPNADSVLWFLTEILPRIQARLGAEAVFTIAGINKSQKVAEAARPGVRLIGPAPDLWDLYDSARVFVAPTRYAAGIPHKVHEAAAHGVPVVGTLVLADQLGWNDAALAVGVDAAAFADKCGALYTDETAWMEIREAGLARIRSECSPDAFERRLKEILDAESACHASASA